MPFRPSMVLVSPAVKIKLVTLTGGEMGINLFYRSVQALNYMNWGTSLDLLKVGVRASHSA
jgi:hypothetical protein